MQELFQTVGSYFLPIRDCRLFPSNRLQFYSNLLHFHRHQLPLFEVSLKSNSLPYEYSCCCPPLLVVFTSIPMQMAKSPLGGCTSGSPKRHPSGKQAQMKKITDPMKYWLV